MIESSFFMWLNSSIELLCGINVTLIDRQYPTLKVEKYTKLIPNDHIHQLRLTYTVVYE